MKFLYPLCTTLLFLLPIHARAHDHEWYVSVDGWLCVQKEVNKYLEQNGNQILIFIEECPDTDLISILQNQVKNSSGSDVRLRKNTPINPAKVITFSRSELICVTKNEIESGREVIAIPKNPTC